MRFTYRTLIVLVNFPVLEIPILTIFSFSITAQAAVVNSTVARVVAVTY